MSISIFIFRRDLRIYDNTGLYEACKKSKKVLPIFIFTKEQLIDNPYKSDNCVQFMMSCLDLLDKNLKKLNSRLFYFFGDPIDILKNILKELKYDTIYVNEDYTPYSIERDNKIDKFCKKNNIKFISSEDILLNPIGSTRGKNGKISNKFGVYFSEASKIKVNEPENYKINNLIKSNFKLSLEFKGNKNKFYKNNPNIDSLADPNILDNIENFDTYDKNRDYLTYETTHLSAYIKFGQVSIREVYYEFIKMGKNSDLVKQLYWRDLFYNIGYDYNQVFDKYSNARSRYDDLDWEDNDEYFENWCNGTTGFPAVDAGMRQLNITGFMHNRARLITAGFLTKVLLNNWKRGEMYFAKNLIDYDPCVNNGNWEWCSSTGIIAQQPHYIFSPWEQSKKHDPDCEYIKKWIPELEDVKIKDIHNWNNSYKKYPDIDYPKPIVDYKEQKIKAKNMFKKVLAN